MVTAALYHSGGSTELGGLIQFLQKTHVQLRVYRKFPAQRKPGPKPTVRPPAPCPEHQGITGTSLISMFFARLRSFPPSESIIVLVDDADCRFRDMTKYHQWVQAIRKRASEILMREVTLVVMLASPEIEAWLVADWGNSFGTQYPEVQKTLRYALSNHFNQYPSLEEFGLRAPDDAGCADKLSEVITMQLRDCSPSATYSKERHGSVMLQRIDPHKVAARCTRFFAPAFHELVNLCEATAA